MRGTLGIGNFKSDPDSDDSNDPVSKLDGGHGRYFGHVYWKPALHSSTMVIPPPLIVGNILSPRSNRRIDGIVCSMASNLNTVATPTSKTAVTVR